MSVDGVSIWWLHDFWLVVGKLGIFWAIPPTGTWADRAEAGTGDLPSPLPPELPEDLTREAWYLLQLPGAAKRGETRDRQARAVLEGYTQRLNLAEWQRTLAEQMADVLTQLGALGKPEKLAVDLDDFWGEPEPRRLEDHSLPPIDPRFQAKLDAFGEKIKQEARA